MVWPRYAIKITNQTDTTRARFPEYTGTIAGTFYFFDPKNRKTRPAFLGREPRINRFILNNLDLYRHAPKKVIKALACDDGLRKYFVDCWHAIEDIIVMSNPHFYDDIQKNNLKKSSLIRLFKYSLNRICLSPYHFASKWKEFSLKMSKRLSGLEEQPLFHFIGFSNGEMNRLWPSLLGEWVLTHPDSVVKATRFSFLCDKSGFPAYPKSFKKEMRIECEDSISHLMRDIKDNRSNIDDLSISLFNSQVRELGADIKERITNQKHDIEHWFNINFSITHFSLCRKAEYSCPTSVGGKLRASLTHYFRKFMQPHELGNIEGYDIFGHHIKILEDCTLYSCYGREEPIPPETYNVYMGNIRSGKYERRRIKSYFNDERLPYNLYISELMNLKDEGFLLNPEELPKGLLWSEKNLIQLHLDTDRLIPAKAIVISERGFKVRVATSVPSFVTVITQPLQVVISRVITLFPELQDSKGSIQSKISTRIASSLEDQPHCMVTDLTDASNMLNQYFCFDLIWEVLKLSGFSDNPVYKLAFEMYTMSCVIEVDTRGFDVIPKGLIHENGKYHFVQKSGILMGRQLTREALLLYVYCCYKASFKLCFEPVKSNISCIGDDLMVYTNNEEIFHNFISVARATDSEIKDVKTRIFINPDRNSYFMFGKRLFRANFDGKGNQWIKSEDDAFVLDSFLLSTICRKENTKTGNKPEISKLKVIKDFFRYRDERYRKKTLSIHHDDNEEKKRYEYIYHCVNTRFLPRVLNDRNIYLLPTCYGGANFFNPFYHKVDDFRKQFEAIPLIVKKLIYLHDCVPGNVVWTQLLFSSMLDCKTDRGEHMDDFLGEIFQLSVETDVFDLNDHQKVVGSKGIFDFKDDSFHFELHEQTKNIKSIRRNNFVSMGQFLSKMAKLTDIYSFFAEFFEPMLGGEGKIPTYSIKRKREPLCVLYFFMAYCPEEIFDRVSQVSDTEAFVYFEKLIGNGFFIRRTKDCFVDCSAIGRSTLDIVMNKDYSAIINLEHPEEVRDRLLGRDRVLEQDDTLTGKYPFSYEGTEYRSISKMSEIFPVEICLSYTN